MSVVEGKKPLVIIGTSGSQDYLKDTGDRDRRYWPVRVPTTIVDQAVEDTRRLVEDTSGKWIGETGDRLTKAEEDLLKPGKWIGETDDRLAKAEEDLLKILLAAPVVLNTAGAGECDGLHDEDAPTLYLCTRCFPLDPEDQDPESHDTE